jgi:hypothetical protein
MYIVLIILLSTLTSYVIVGSIFTEIEFRNPKLGTAMLDMIRILSCTVVSFALCILSFIVLL